MDSASLPWRALTWCKRRRHRWWWRGSSGGRDACGCGQRSAGEGALQLVGARGARHAAEACVALSLRFVLRLRCAFNPPSIPSKSLSSPGAQSRAALGRCAPLTDGGAPRSGALGAGCGRLESRPESRRRESRRASFVEEARAGAGRGALRLLPRGRGQVTRATRPLASSPGSTAAAQRSVCPRP